MSFVIRHEGAAEFLTAIPRGRPNPSPVSTAKQDWRFQLGWGIADDAIKFSDPVSATEFAVRFEVVDPFEVVEL